MTSNKDSIILNKKIEDCTEEELRLRAEYDILGINGFSDEEVEFMIIEKGEFNSTKTAHLHSNDHGWTFSTKKQVAILSRYLRSSYGAEKTLLVRVFVEKVSLDSLMKAANDTYKADVEHREQHLISHGKLLARRAKDAVNKEATLKKKKAEASTKALKDTLKKFGLSEETPVSELSEEILTAYTSARSKALASVRVR